MTALHSQVLGSGPPLLILHGLFGSSSNWRSIGKQLAQSFQVHLLDLRNHGNSFWSETMSYPAMAQDVLAYIHVNNLNRPIVIGHSMGGKVAMTLALSFAELIKVLLVVDIAPVAYHHDHSAYIEAMQALPLEQIIRRSDADTALAQGITEQSIRQFLLQNLSMSERPPKWRINLNALSSNMAEISSFPDFNQQQYLAPTLIIRGAYSHYVQKQHHQTLRTYFPTHQIQTIANAGHWLHAEQTKLFMQQVTQFLSIPSL